jgi:carbamoyl-phosphate synthase small subunit
MPAHLVLEDGTAFSGRSVGASGIAAGEACFTTAMAGYEEAVTDPSYVAQVLCFSYPLVGNYGVDSGRLESERVQTEGVVMRRARPAWAAWLRKQGVVALEDVDTRALVRRIRDGGVLRCALGEAPLEELQARALAEPGGRHAATVRARRRAAGDDARPGDEAFDPRPAGRLRARGERGSGQLGR